MTKEEFFNMFNSELESLEAQIEKANKTVGYYSLISKGSEEDLKNINFANYQMQLLINRKSLLTDYVGFLAYARIQAMSDLEIEEYKKEKTEELNYKILGLTFTEESEKINFEILKSKRELLILKLGSLTEDERAVATDDIKEAQDLEERLFEYETKSDENIFTKNQKEIQAIKDLQESINKKTSQELKDEICSKIKEKKDFEESIERYHNEDVLPADKLLASVAGDTDKTKEIAELMIKQSQLSFEISEISGKVNGYTWEELPREFQTKMQKFGLKRLHLDGDTCDYRFDVYKLEEMSQYIAEFKAKFEQEKERLSKEITREKFDKIYPGNEHEIDYDFLSIHEDKIPEGDLEYLRSLDKKRSELKPWFFNRKKVNDIEKEVYSVRENIYSKIRSWYKAQDLSVLGIYNFNDGLLSNHRLYEAINLINGKIKCAENALNLFASNFNADKARMEEEKAQILREIQSCTEKIRAIAGPGFEEIEIPAMLQINVGGSGSLDFALSLFKQASTIVQTKEIITAVQDEAKNQADIRESELRGITIEELMQLKKEAMQKLEENEQQLTVFPPNEGLPLTSYLPEDKSEEQGSISQFIENTETGSVIEGIEKDIAIQIDEEKIR